MTPDERELRRALDGRSGEPSPEFRARISSLRHDERPPSRALSSIALLAVAVLTIATIGVLLFARQALGPVRSGPASATRLPSPTPTPFASPTPTHVFLPQTAQISAPSADILWVYFGQGLLFRSTDRGDTWVQRSLATQNLSPLANVTFVDDQHGWLFTGGSPETQCNGAGTGIWQTNDGAATWKQLALVDGTSPSASGIGLAQCKQNLSFIDPTHGFLGAWDDNHPPTIYRTSDGGRSWTGSTLPDPPGFVSQNGGFELRAGLVKGFGTTLLATASGRQEGDVQDRIYIFTSTDGGASWSYLARLPNAAGTLAVVTASRWLLIVPGGPSLETADAGRSWHAYVSDYQQAAGVAPQIVFGDSLTGYATVRGSIQRTTDGGAHWVMITTPGT
jgi:photosystem II stability/assembly factor-like uncharacterized protein